MIKNGRSLVADEEIGTTSSLSAMQQKLIRASILKSACETARASVDQALSVVEQALVDFRIAVAGLSESILDIILAGMNAGLKAGHLGSQGRAFVVIAGELKSTADRISATAALLNPKLHQIATITEDLNRRRANQQSAQVEDHEAALAHAMTQIAAGSAHLEQLMSGMVDAGVKFEASLSEGKILLKALAENSIILAGSIDVLPRICNRSEMQSVDRDSVEAVLDELYASYSMTEERDIHRAFLRGQGLGQRESTLPQKDAVDTDAVLFF